MIKKMIILLFIVLAVSIGSRVFIAIQYNVYDFNNEDDYKVYDLNVSDILEMRNE